jgi:hypothetical protein
MCLWPGGVCLLQFHQLLLDLFELVLQLLDLLVLYGLGVGILHRGLLIGLNVLGS